MIDAAGWGHRNGLAAEYAGCAGISQTAVPAYKQHLVIQYLHGKEATVTAAKDRSFRGRAARRSECFTPLSRLRGGMEITLMSPNGFLCDDSDIPS